MSAKALLILWFVEMAIPLVMEYGVGNQDLVHIVMHRSARFPSMNIEPSYEMNHKCK